MDKFAWILKGRKFEWHTDSQAVAKAIIQYETTGIPSNFLARRLTKLQEYNFTIKHVEGKSLCADYASRYHGSDNDGMLLCNSLLLETRQELEARAIHNQTHASIRNFRRHLLQKGIKLSRNEIREIIRGCMTCQKAKSRPATLKEKTTTIPENPMGRGKCYTLDHGAIRNKKYIIAIQDIFTKELSAYVKIGHWNSDQTLKMVQN